MLKLESERESERERERRVYLEQAAERVKPKG